MNNNAHGDTPGKPESKRCWNASETPAIRKRFEIFWPQSLAVIGIPWKDFPLRCDNKG